MSRSLVTSGGIQAEEAGASGRAPEYVLPTTYSGIWHLDIEIIVHCTMHRAMCGSQANLNASGGWVCLAILASHLLWNAWIPNRVFMHFAALPLLSSLQGEGAIGRYGQAVESNCTPAPQVVGVCGGRGGRDPHNWVWYKMRVFAHFFFVNLQHDFVCASQGWTLAPMMRPGIMACGRAL